MCQIATFMLLFVWTCTCKLIVVPCELGSESLSYKDCALCCCAVLAEEMVQLKHPVRTVGKKAGEPEEHVESRSMTNMEAIMQQVRL